MPAGRYRFHCTDGHTAVFDRKGRSIRNVELVWMHAERVAHEIMARFGGRLDWTDWIVDVHDPVGRRAMTLGFPDVRPVQDVMGEGCGHDVADELHRAAVRAAP